MYTTGNLQQDNVSLAHLTRFMFIVYCYRSILFRKSHPLVWLFGDIFVNLCPVLINFERIVPYDKYLFTINALSLIEVGGYCYGSRRKHGFQAMCDSCMVMQQRTLDDHCSMV